MKTKLKTAGLVIAAVVLVAVSILGTMAYLTDQTDVVTNTFTVGKVDINLDETKYPCTPQGDEPCERVKANVYHLMPGGTYAKDPTVTVLEGSEESYVRIFMTINQQANLDAIFPGNGFDNLIIGLDDAIWTFIDYTYDVGANTRTYEFRYYKTVSGADGMLEPLFTQVAVPGTVTNQQLASLMEPEGSELAITLIAQAIQAEGFTNADDAWTAFDAPVAP